MKATISKSALKAKMLQLFRELEASGGELIVTDRGRPVLKITPIEEKAIVEELFADVRGKVVILEDLDAPTLSEWEDA